MAPTKRELEENFFALCEETHFEIDEVELLYEIFVTLQQSGPHGTPVIDGATLRTVLRKSFNMSDAAMMDRIVQAFTPTTTFDAHCNWEEFIKGMSVFLRGTLEEQTECKQLMGWNIINVVFGAVQERANVYFDCMQFVSECTTASNGTDTSAARKCINYWVQQLFHPQAKKIKKRPFETSLNWY
eukprot:m.781854 g.781854  ORF g.781854 m.781854 type:complete len:185 (-) comp23287_c0_seq35:2389-2943(-)